MDFSVCFAKSAKQSTVYNDVSLIKLSFRCCVDLMEVDVAILTPFPGLKEYLERCTTSDIGLISLLICI